MFGKCATARRICDRGAASGTGVREGGSWKRRAGGWSGAFVLSGGGKPGGVEEELEFGVAAADSLGDPFFDEPFRGGAVAGRGGRLQAGQ